MKKKLCGFCLGTGTELRNRLPRWCRMGCEPKWIVNNYTKLSKKKVKK